MRKGFSLVDVHKYRLETWTARTQFSVLYQNLWEVNKRSAQHKTTIIVLCFRAFCAIYACANFCLLFTSVTFRSDRYRSRCTSDAIKAITKHCMCQVHTVFRGAFPSLKVSSINWIYRILETQEKQFLPGAKEIYCQDRIINKQAVVGQGGLKIAI